MDSNTNIEHGTHGWDPVSTHGNWYVLLRLDGITQRERKIIKRAKYYSYREICRNQG